MDSETEQAVVKELSDALCDVLARRGEMPTSWLAVVESIDRDGEPGIWMVAPEDMPQWRALGLIEYARYRQTVGEEAE